MRTRRIRNIVMVFLVILFASLSFGADEQALNLKSIVKGNTAFAIDLYSLLKNEEGNLFFSPYSISAALAMTYGGARGNTAKEMQETLHFPPEEQKTHLAFTELDIKFDQLQAKENVQLHIANSLWPQNGYFFLPEYISLIEKHYGVTVTPVDYIKDSEKAREIINTWVEDETKEKIKDLIRKGDVDGSTVMVLVNAIYFKGNWASQFSPDNTIESDFILLSGQKKQVSMMQQKGIFGYRKIEGAQMLELPYVGKGLSMVLILPDEAGGVSNLEDQLSVENLDSWLSNISQKDVNVYLPKFKITWGTFKLNKPLITLGMESAFSPTADFSGMNGRRDLSIGAVLHKAFVEVNEEGTEAAAATAVVMRKAIARVHTFRVDHPFIFLIRDNSTGSILFIGRVIDPTME